MTAFSEPEASSGDDFLPVDLETRGRAARSAFVPLLLVTLALVAWLAFQAWQLVREQRQLEVAQEALQPQLQQSTKLRASLDAVATATAKLAAGGNAHAQVIVDELRKRGVTIKPVDAPKTP